jgi:hypothetical protein
MGFKQVELVPVSTTGPTTLIPSGKSTNGKIFQVSRSDTTPAVLKAVLPGSASILSINIHGSTNSDAATTATVIITVSNNTGVISTGTAVDVKGSGTVSALVQMSALPNIEPLPLAGDLLIKAVYAETGTASTTGGPWVFDINYVS